MVSLTDRKAEHEFQTLHCDRCKGWLKLELKNFAEAVDGIQINVPEMPMLSCPACGAEYQPDWTKSFINYIVEESKKKGTKLFSGNRKRDASKVRYSLCNSVNFEYDASDCKFIPGLQSQFAAEGFFTPVFFNKRVLQKYMNLDGYHVDIAGNTYGTIYHEDWQLSFGINRTGKLFVWLGDLDEIPENEQQYFLSENEQSDHDVGSDFYLGQREAEFCELSNEGKLLEDKSAFGKSCFDKYRLNVYHYETDIYENLRELIRPVNWNEKRTIHVVNSMNKICVESIDTNALKEDIKKLEPSFSTTGLGGLKLLQKWIGLRYPTLDAAEIMKPFFVLYDWRLIYDHKMSKDEQEIRLDSCYERLNVKPRNLESLYDAVVSSMSISFNKLS